MDFDKLIDEDIRCFAQIGVTLPINAVVLRDYLPLTVILFMHIRQSHCGKTQWKVDYRS